MHVNTPYQSKRWNFHCIYNDSVLHRGYIPISICLFRYAIFGKLVGTQSRSKINGERVDHQVRFRFVDYAYSYIFNTFILRLIICSISNHARMLSSSKSFKCVAGGSVSCLTASTWGSHITYLSNICPKLTKAYNISAHLMFSSTRFLQASDDFSIVKICVQRNDFIVLFDSLVMILLYICMARDIIVSLSMHPWMQVPR